MQKGYNAKGSGAEEEIFFVVAGALPVEVSCFYMRPRPTPFCLCDSLCVSIGMCVRAYVCLYVCVSIGMCVCVSIGMYVYVCVCVV